MSRHHRKCGGSGGHHHRSKEVKVKSKDECDISPKLSKCIQEIVDIMYDDDLQDYLKDNQAALFPTMRFLMTTVLEFDGSTELPPKKSAKTKSAHGQRPRRNSNECFASFGLDLLMKISMAAASDDGFVLPVCDYMIDLKQEDFWYHLNNRLFHCNASASHLGILVNYTRYPPIGEMIAERVFMRFESSVLEKVVENLRDPDNPVHHDNRVYNDKYMLSAYLVNLAQDRMIRRKLAEEKLALKLMECYEAIADVKVKRNIVSVVRNLAIDADTHHNLITKDEDELLIKLVMPLAGGEQFDEEQMKELPLDLQYLPEDKVREPDADVRVLLLETLYQLCNTRRLRMLMRDYNIYYLLREYHKWEKDAEALYHLENVVDILIKKEEEIGFGDVNVISELDVSDELRAKFEMMEADFRREFKRERIHRNEKTLIMAPDIGTLSIGLDNYYVDKKPEDEEKKDETSSSD